MVEGRQLLMSMARQFQDDFELSIAISKAMAMGWDTATSRIKCFINMVSLTRIKLHLCGTTF